MKKYLIILLMPVLIILPKVPGSAQDKVKWADCVEAAKKNNPDIQSAAEKVSQAKASAGITKSTMLPSVDANASVAKSKTTGDRVSSTSDTYSYGITGQQLLFDGGKTVYDAKNSGKLIESANYDLQVVSATVRQNLRYAFVNLLIAQELVNINKEIIAIRKKNLELVKMRYNAGLEHLGSLLTAEANMAQAELEVAQSEREIIIYQRNLAVNMGLSSMNSLMAEGVVEFAGKYDQKPDFENLADSNPEVKGIIQQRIAAEYNLKSAKLAYSPSIYGVASVSRAGTINEPETKSTEYSAGVQMSLNLFQGGKSSYQTSLAESEMKQLFADEKSTRATVLYYLENAWFTLQNKIDTINVKKKLLKATEERTKIADAQYSIGTIEFDSWTVIQDNYVNAKKSILEAESAALLSEADWIQAQGGTLTYGE